MPLNSHNVKFHYIVQGGTVIGRDTDTVYFNENDHSISVGNVNFSGSANWEAASGTPGCVDYHPEIYTGFNNSTNTRIQSALRQGSNTATGEYSVALGNGTTSASNSQTVIGKFNVQDSSSNYALIIGNGTDSSHRSNALAIGWDGLIYVNNAQTGVDVSSLSEVYDAGQTVDAGTTYTIDGTTYTVGDHAEIFNDYTTHIAIGKYSHVEGLPSRQYDPDPTSPIVQVNIAYCPGSHVEGVGNVAGAGGNPIIIDDYTFGIHAEGYKTVANHGNGAHSEGYETKSMGSGCHAEGENTVAGTNPDNPTFYHSACHAEGCGTKAYGDYSHSEGGYTVSSGEASHSEGESTVSSGSCSHSEGYQTEASGSSAHSEGRETKAYAYYSHSEGYQSVVGISGRSDYGQYGHAEGCNTTVNGDCGHSEGQETVVKFTACHAEGSHTQAGGTHTSYPTVSGGSYAHAEGYYSLALEDYSHAEGFQNHAFADASHAECYMNTVQWGASHVSGYHNIIDINPNPTDPNYNPNTWTDNPKYVIGTYNDYAYDDFQYTAFVIGNGTADNARSNCFSVDFTGNVKASGKVTVGSDPTESMDVATKKYVDNNISSIGSSIGQLFSNYGQLMTMVWNLTRAIAPSYNSSNTYATGDVCTNGQDLYRCLSSTTGTWDATAWEKISVIDLI